MQIADLEQSNLYLNGESQMIVNQFQMIEDWVKEKIEPLLIILSGKKYLTKSEIRKEIIKISEIDFDFSMLMNILRFKKYQNAKIFPDMTNPNFKIVKN